MENEAPAKIPAKQPSTTLKTHVSKTGRKIWSAIGVLTTLGGVFGLYQMVFKPDRTAISGNSAEEVIVAMVENKVIDIEEAGRIVSSLTSGSNGSDISADTVQGIAENGTDAQRRGLLLLAEKHTREEGIEILANEAKTSEDWELLARLYGSNESEEALSAIKKSIALDPENFGSISLLAGFQALRGDFASAKRSAVTADLLADSPEEKLLSAQGFLNIVAMARDLVAVKEKQAILDTAINAYDASVAQTDTSQITFGAYRDQPAWLLAMAHNELANSYLVRLQGETEEKEKPDAELVNSIIHYAEQSVAVLNPLISRVHRDDRFPIINNIASSQNRKAYAYFANDEFEKGVEISRDVLDMIRDEAETGDRRAIEALPQYYRSYSAYLINNGDNDEALKAMRRSTDLQISYARKFEEENLDIKVASLELNYDIMTAASGDLGEIDESLDHYMGMAEKHFADDPQDRSEDKVFRAYLGNVASVSGFYVTDRFGVQSETKALQPIMRAAKFNSGMIEAHGPSHDRLHYDYYFSILTGDTHYRLDNKEKALKHYQSALEKAPKIPPKEDEEFVVEQSKLESYLRIASLELEPSDDAITKGLEIAQELDAAKELRTQYQGYYHQLTKMAKDRGIAFSR